ncbi:hypothetical protein [Pseudomonas brenneri]|uniref:hypothetical protein n=1 Tax=Pseudomonas brenneri TaxID=129817 RepID=UPI003BA316CC
MIILNQQFRALVELNALAALRALAAESWLDENPCDSDSLADAKVLARSVLEIDFDSMDQTQLAAWYENSVGYNPVDDDATLTLEQLRTNCKEMALIERCGGIDTAEYQHIEAQRRAATEV